jgi:hypothetical protein
MRGIPGFPGFSTSREVVMQRRRWIGRAIGVAVASGLGIMVALVDRAAPFGDDSEKSTIVLWLVCCGVFGFAAPGRPWRWALLVGPWLPAMYLMLHSLGAANPIHPDTYTGILILIPVSLAICGIGAYAGAAARRVVRPPSLAAEASSSTAV